MTEARAITVKGPWAQAIARWGKVRENRGSGFPSRYRGLVLIHVGQAWSKRGAEDLRVVDAAGRSASPPAYWTQAQLPGLRAVDSTGFERGAILAVAHLVDVHPATDACCEPGGGCHPWGERTYQAADGKVEGNPTHLVLEEVRELANPVPWRKGALGLWTPPAELVAECLEEAAALEWA